MWSPLALIEGPQGSGKTTACHAIAHHAVANGFVVIVADPDYRKGEWPLLPVIGKGGDYEACDRLMGRIMGICKAKYVERAEYGTKPHEFKPILFIAEEFTDWSEECARSEDFVKKAKQKFRKANIPFLLASHGDTLPQLGGAKGHSKSLKEGMAHLHLDAHSVPINGGYEDRPTGTGTFKPKGAQTQEVRVPNMLEVPQPNIPDTSQLTIDELFSSYQETGSESSAEAQHLNTEKVALIEDYKLPGVNKTLSEAANRLIEWMAKEFPGKTITMRRATQAYPNAQRNAYEKQMPAICAEAQKNKPGNIIFKKNHLGELKICYQEKN